MLYGIILLSAVILVISMITITGIFIDNREDKDE